MSGEARGTTDYTDFTDWEMSGEARGTTDYTDFTD